jgi:hypothetical protein
MKMPAPTAVPIAPATTINQSLFRDGGTGARYGS